MESDRYARNSYSGKCIRMDIYHGDLPNGLKTDWQTYGLKPQDLHLEITESRSYIGLPANFFAVVKASIPGL